MCVYECVSQKIMPALIIKGREMIRNVATQLYIGPQKF